MHTYLSSIFELICDVRAKADSAPEREGKQFYVNNTEHVQGNPCLFAASRALEK